MLPLRTAHLLTRAAAASTIALAVAVPAAAVAAAPPATAPHAAVSVAGSPAPTVGLLRAHVARSRPASDAGGAVRVPALRPITLARTVLPVLERATDAAGHRWLRVLLPGRPNGATGWITARGTVARTSPWALELDLSARRLTVRRAGRVVRRFATIVGAPGTPTPRGRFFVEETVRLPGGRVAGPYALALSARSNVLQEFDGGPGQIALHGRDGGLGGTLGTAVSHGCVRLSDHSLEWLATRIGPGVRVTIHG